MDISKKIYLAKRYARIFLNDKMSPPEILTLAAEIQFISDSLQKDPFFVEHFILNPKFNDHEKENSILKFSEKGGLSVHTKELLRILVKKNRIEILPFVAQELHKVADIILNRVRVKMTTAFEPDAIEIKDISKTISSFFGKNVFVERHIDQSLIGGFVLEGDGKLVDLSLKGQLRKNLLGI